MPGRKRFASYVLLVCFVLILGLIFWPHIVNKQPERQGILSSSNLDSGFYVLVFAIGEPDLRRSYPADPLVRILDDQALIGRYRNEIDITHGLTDFLPAEGRPSDIFLYVYRDGIRIAGTTVTQAERVKIPAALLQASRIVPMRMLVDDFDKGAYLGETLSSRAPLHR